MKSRVCVCSNPDCARPFPRFRRDFPPPGFCSVECKEQHQRRHQNYDTGRVPQFFVSLLKDHLETKHHTADLTAWFDGCAECEQLAARYAESLNRQVQA
jgi:hypothetical protein